MREMNAIVAGIDQAQRQLEAGREMRGGTYKNIIPCLTCKGGKQGGKDCMFCKGTGRIMVAMSVARFTITELKHDIEEYESMGHLDGTYWIGYSSVINQLGSEEKFLARMEAHVNKIDNPVIEPEVVEEEECGICKGSGQTGLYSSAYTGRLEYIGMVSCKDCK